MEDLGLVVVARIAPLNLGKEEGFAENFRSSLPIRQAGGKLAGPRVRGRALSAANRSLEARATCPMARNVTRT
jgi:hypothetical protein